MIIRVEGLVKEFGSHTVVDHVHFDIPKGEVFGLLGPNGAGKTTTIRILTGVLPPTAGNVTIAGYNIQNSPIEAKQMMGIVPEMANAYTDFSALRNLLFMGELYGIEKKKNGKNAERLLKMFHLYDRRNQKVKTFSKGMKQRVILAMALMNDAEILFLDEPTSGLDVESVRLIRGLIREFSANGMTIFLTTHDIEEANQLCDRVAIMNHGKIVVIDRPENLKNTIQSTSSVEVAFAGNVHEKDLKFKETDKVVKTGDKFRIYAKHPGAIISTLTSYSKHSGNEIISLNTLGPSLEDVFIQLTGEKTT